MDFLVDRADEKMWFYDLITPGQLISSSFRVLIQTSHCTSLFWYITCLTCLHKNWQYFIMEKHIPTGTWDIQLYRNRLALLLYNHGRKKQVQNIESDSEANGKIDGPAISLFYNRHFNKKNLKAR